MPMIQNDTILAPRLGQPKTRGGSVTIADKVRKVLENEYFDHHTAMHLGRQRLVLPNGCRKPLFLPPHACACCNDDMQMIEAGQEGSGVQFLQMHHEMIRVFRFLLDQDDLGLLARWKDGKWEKKPSPHDHHEEYYEPELWDLDDHRNLPREIVGMLNVTDPNFLELAFAGVQQRTSPKLDISSESEVSEAIDDLGMFIERGVNQKKDEKVNGSGFHNTVHVFLGSREGKAARGAEMNRLRNSLFNDYFWSLHLWIDGQYGRLLKHCNKDFNNRPLDPEESEMFTHKDPHGPASGMSMA